VLPIADLYASLEGVSTRHLESDISEFYTKVYVRRDTISKSVISSSINLDTKERRRLRKARQSPIERQSVTYGWEVQHFNVASEEDNPVVTHRFLGHGSLGIVEEVRRSNTQVPTFVRKRVQIPTRKREAKATLDIIQQEARNLKALVHPHIVTLFGTYKETKHSNAHFYSLLMSPRERQT
jgi:hypothetical protein